MARQVRTITKDNGAVKDTNSMAVAIHGYNTTNKAFVPLNIGDDGKLITNTVVTGDVKIDIDSVSAEMKVDTGHDLYIAQNPVKNGTWTITFDSISGLKLKDIQAVENKTKGFVYLTKGATVTDTSILLVSANQPSGVTAPAVSDEVEIVYRGTSRFDNKATEATLNSVKTQTDKLTFDGDDLKVKGSVTTDVETGLAKDSTLTNASQKSQVVDSSGNVIGATSNALDVNIKSSGVTIGGNAEKQPGQTAATHIVQNGGIAETTVPTAVADGDAVAQWFNKYGQPVLFGANLSSNALDVIILNQAQLNVIAPLTLLNAVTATGASVEKDLSTYNKVKFQIVKTGTATVDIQESLDNTTYDDVQTDVDGIVTISDQTMKYVKVNVSAYTSGNVTVKMIAGR